ncbi:N-acetyltransferase [Alicyclobacillus fastidiosus]|nr:N-acetyltransferase [Alicyclobacillus fastidiosus]
MIEVRTIEQHDYERAHAFQSEYLDREKFPEFVQRVAANPDLYFVAVNGDELIGICYGHPSKKDESVITLQGIAVDLNETKGYARVGIGSRMIRVFESAVKTRGYRKIAVGSADDPTVEKFYLKNGFKPTELVAKGLHYEEYERISIDDYEVGNVRREELWRKYAPKEVIFIFEKSIG